ncbi:hypothetical protein M0811_00618 [Anaeramoeba ignava]|uniref:BTB domain-containing protein n=1 Tax=Anaeramoeba ignava TaxID=1746090 RepID=A0A9Q0LQV1_ANAIG|nr:hypothetical protein M0811_00618 [Anaeramoeba ignava]
METYLNLEKLSNDLKNLFQNQNQNENQNESYFDFEIICEQNQISFKTHKSILSSRNVSSSILFPILNYFYSGKIEINLENVIQILIFSSKYLIDELIEISSNFIKKNFQIETIVDILKLSESMNLNQLLDSSYQFIFENFEEFIKTSFFFELEENHLNSILLNDELSINEFELFQSIIKWGKHKSNINQEKELEKEEKEQIQIQISNIIDKIRFIDFTNKELKTILKEDLIPNQISEKLIQFQKLDENDKNEKELKQFIEKENSLIFKSRLDKYIFGGFTQIGFISDQEFWESKDSGGGWIKDINAFIFSLRNNKNDRKPSKFEIKQGGRNALFYRLNCGPKFSGDISLNSNLQAGYTEFGYMYQLPKGMKPYKDEARNYLAGSRNKWIIEEVETYFIKNKLKN